MTVDDDQRGELGFSIAKRYGVMYALLVADAVVLLAPFALNATTPNVPLAWIGRGALAWLFCSAILVSAAVVRWRRLRRAGAADDPWIFALRPSVVGAAAVVTTATFVILYVAVLAQAVTATSR